MWFLRNPGQSSFGRGFVSQPSPWGRKGACGGTRRLRPKARPGTVWTSWPRAMV